MHRTSINNCPSDCWWYKGQCLLVKLKSLTVDWVLEHLDILLFSRKNLEKVYVAEIARFTREANHIKILTEPTYRANFARDIEKAKIERGNAFIHIGLAMATLLVTYLGVQIAVIMGLIQYHIDIDEQCFWLIRIAVLSLLMFIIWSRYVVVQNLKIYAIEYCTNTLKYT